MNLRETPRTRGVWKTMAQARGYGTVQETVSLEEMVFPLARHGQRRHRAEPQPEGL